MPRADLDRTTIVISGRVHQHADRGQSAGPAAIEEGHRLAPLAGPACPAPGTRQCGGRHRAGQTLSRRPAGRVQRAMMHRLTPKMPLHSHATGARILGRGPDRETRSVSLHTRWGISEDTWAASQASRTVIALARAGEVMRSPAPCGTRSGKPGAMREWMAASFLAGWSGG